MTNLPSNQSPEASPQVQPPDHSAEVGASSHEDAVVGDAVPMVMVGFTLPAEVDARAASVVGDFNGWDAAKGSMTRDQSGAFWCSFAVLSGRTYQYRFLLDGDRWMNDWTADSYAPNSFGGEDSVLDLTGSAHDVAATELETARADNKPVAGAIDRPDDGMAPLINNTGDDGGAGSG